MNYLNTVHEELGFEADGGQERKFAQNKKQCDVGGGILPIPRILVTVIETNIILNSAECTKERVYQ